MTKRRKRTKPKRKATTTRASPQARQWVAALSALGNESWEEAVAILQQFLQGVHDPVEQVPIYHNMATCYLEQGLYKEAQATWTQLEEVQGEHADGWFGRAITYGCSGQLDKAIAAFEQFQYLAPKRARQLEVDRLIANLQQEQRGEIVPGSFLYEHLNLQLEDNFDLGDYDMVEHKARQMIAIDNGRPEPHFFLGLALLRQKRAEEAVPAFLQANKLEPDYVPTLHNIGYCYFQLNQPDEALGWLDRVLQQDETYLAAWHIKGQIYEKLGNREKAIALWQQALSIKPDYEPVQYALFEAGVGAEPKEPPSDLTRQLQQMGPIVKARMRQPQVYRNGDVRLTFDPEVGFVLEDEGNIHNGTIYAGSPFRLARMRPVDIRHFIGFLKLMVRQVNNVNCRDMAILAYYPDESSFS